MSYYIGNKHDAKFYYMMLCFDKRGGMAIPEDMKVEIKRAIRAYTHRGLVDGDPFDYYHTFCADMDGYYSVFPLGDGINSEEEAKESFMENDYLESPHSMYDCTGSLFTRDFKVFKRRGEWWAYHKVDRDI